MDKNSILGLLLIGGILIGWLVMSQPSKEELAKQQLTADSLANYEQTQKTLADAAAKTALTKTVQATAAIPDSLMNSDSVKAIIKKQAFGAFAQAASGTNKSITLENDVLKINLSSKGGRVASVELKNYKTFDGKPLILFYADSSAQNLSFTANSLKINTDSLYFTNDVEGFTVAGDQSKSISLKAYAGDQSKYIEYVYTLKGNDYLVGFTLNAVGLQDVIAANTKKLDLNWTMKLPKQELHTETQQNASTVYYMNGEEEVDKLSEATDEKVVMPTKTKWIGFKQQFFTSVLIADKGFETLGDLESKRVLGGQYIKEYAANMAIPYTHTAAESFPMKFYFGPNHYQTLKGYDIGLEKQINLGWKIFGWMNRFLVIPIFNVLDNMNLNYGIIILILTIIIKLLLLPIAYKTVLSSAKMKVLKPEIDALNEKYKDGDAMQKQQATMALYKQAGVNPMAGCIPVLLQMPILIALFNFFPASIEMRQQGFLWAHDLSTYDSVYDFGFNIPWYGDHVSLFALLMTGSTLLYTWSNSQLMGNTNQMPGMKWMMYLMPILFLGFLNNYSAGLSWYYFLANMFTFGQTWVMQKFVIDHDALHRKIQENKLKPKKVSKFQQRLEEMAKQQQQGKKK
jgi:YidC/Oxa1 family membrane protein insertase